MPMSQMRTEVNVKSDWIRKEKKEENRYFYVVCLSEAGRSCLHGNTFEAEI